MSESTNPSYEPIQLGGGTTDLNAFRDPYVVKQGCQHRLGCRCPVPYRLRESSPDEQQIEQYRNRL